MRHAPGTKRAWRFHAGLAVAALVGAGVFAAPLFAVSAPEVVRIPQVRPREKPPAAVFAHWRHNTFQCYSCHPSVFPQAPLGFTHQEMQAGRYCGSCHNGLAAKATTAMRCEDCHVP